MKHLDIINQFREGLAKLTVEVEASVAMDHFDVNRICENLICGLFQNIYNFQNLRNLNVQEKRNFPGIDLADDSARVAIQVTSERSLKKVKNSLQKVIDYSLYKKYDRIIVYILTRKQSSYSQEKVNEICRGKLKFNVKSDVLDYNDLASKASSVCPRNLKRAVNILNEYTKGSEVGSQDTNYDPPINPVESLYSNLLELYFPNNLYLAEILPEVTRDKTSRSCRNPRTKVRGYVRNLNHSVPSDFEVYNSKLLTFHDLTDQNNVFVNLVDPDTVEKLFAIDYYSINVNRERVFKSLLRFCLQQKLYENRVRWQHKERIFIFLPFKDSQNERRISSLGRRKTSRIVFKRKMKNNKPNEILSTKHLAFSADFLQVFDRWYVSITPEWYFSCGKKYLQSPFNSEQISNLKRLERNRSVLGHVKFLCSWLQKLDTEHLFSYSENSTPQVTFGEILEINGGRCLNEELWCSITEVNDELVGQQSINF